MDSNCYRLNKQFGLVESQDPFHDLTDNALFEYLSSDLTQECFPPLFIISDTIRLLQFYKKIKIKRINGFEERFLHRYRNLFIFRLLNQDPGIHHLHKIILSKGRSERRFFIPFIVREISRQIMTIFRFDSSLFTEQPFEPAFIHGQLVRQTRHFLDNFLLSGPLFSPEQIQLYSFIRKEEDIPIIKSYSKALKFLSPATPVEAGPSFDNTHNIVESQGALSAFMGGISGIRSGAAPDNFSDIIPSEFALMEKDQPIDLFDVHLIENKLLSFTRDQSFTTLATPKLHIAFLTPDSLEYQPQIIPFRYLYFFMPIFFSVIRYCNIHFNATQFSFYPVSKTGSWQNKTAYQLIEIVKQRDFADLEFNLKPIELKALTGLMGKAAEQKSKEDVFICLSHPGAGLDDKNTASLKTLGIEYGGQNKTDIVEIFHPKMSDKPVKTFTIDRPESIAVHMNAARDLFVEWILFNTIGELQWQQ